jgi:PAS domain S-box-containing protein
MKKTSPAKMSEAGRKTKSGLDVKTATRKKIQRVEQKVDTAQTLIDSELRYRRLFETAQDGILILDAQTGAIDDVNPYLIDMLGYSRAEFVKKKLWEVGAFKDVDASKIAFEALQEKGYVRYENLPLMTKHGQLIQVEFVSNVYTVGSQKVIQCNIRDITDRVKAEQAAQLQDRRLRALIENATDALTLLDAQGNIIYDSPAAPGMLGYGALEWIGQKVFEIFHPDDLRKSLDLFQQVLKTPGRRVDGRFRVRHKNGSWIWIEGIATNLLEEPAVNAIVLNYRDITSKMAAEKAFALSEERFRSIIELSSDIVSLLDENGTILYSSPVILKLLGYAPEERLGHSATELLHPDDAPKVLQALDQVAKQAGAKETITERFLHKDGTWRWLETTLTNLLASPAVHAIVTRSRDITDRKQAEEALRASEARFRGLFEDSPISLWEEDFSAVKQRLDALREGGVTDFEAYFTSHQELIAECAALIKILNVNNATMHLFGTNRKEDLLQSVDVLLEGKPSPTFQNQLIGIAEGKTRFAWEGVNKTLDGRLIDIQLIWAAVRGYEKSLSRVNVSMIDVTERKRAEAEIRALAKFPNENPFPVLRLDNNGIILYANPASHAVLEDWKTAIGQKAPAFWLKAATEALANQSIQILETSIGDKVFLFGIVPILETAYVNIYGHDITQHKQADARIQDQLSRLAALHEIDRYLSSSFDLHMTLNAILEHVKKQLGVDAADVLLLNSTTLSLEYGAGLGFRTQAVLKENMRLGQGLAGMVALKRELVQIQNLKDQTGDELLKTQLEGEDFVCYFGVPLVAKGGVKGVLEVYQRSPLKPDPDWLDFLNNLAGQAALAIEDSQLFENLQRSNIELTLAYNATIEGWSHAMDLRDKETEGHTQRVTQTTLELAALFGIRDEDLIGIRRGALLHDIGKMGVPDSILLKSGPLTDDEWVPMRRHPALAFEMLAPIHYLKSAIDIPYCHHEKWDGTGYPRGLQGSQIPLAARIFAIVDVWDALTSDRPYRKAWSHEKAIEYIRSQAGSHFDPEIVKVCLDSGILDGRRPKPSKD